MPRPKAKIDAVTVSRMALEGARNTDIADHFGVDESTIRDRFPEILRKKRAERRMNLRRMQYQKAMRGDGAMLIWLGKNELEQADRQAIEHSGELKQTVTFVMPRPEVKPR